MYSKTAVFASALGSVFKKLDKQPAIIENIYMNNIRHELTDKEWNRIKDLLPPERTGKRGRPSKDNRRVINAIVWLLRTGAPWRDLPAEFGSWKSIYTRFRRWNINGLWQEIFTALSQQNDAEALIIDSTVIRAHQHAAGAKGGSITRH